MRRQLQAFLLLLPLLAGGCATNALWTRTRMDAWNEPAANGCLKLFEARRENDFLAVYDEYSERHDCVRERAYFLNQNEKRVAEGRKPRFVDVRANEKLPLVPVLFAPPISTNSPETVYALMAADRQSFKLFSGGSAMNYNLPQYNDDWGPAGRIALTPVAVVADLSIIGGFLFLECWAEGGLNGVVITAR